MDNDATMELDEAMGLEKAIAVAFSSQEFAYLMLYLLSVTVLYVYFYFSGKAKDKKYIKETESNSYTLRYYRKDMAWYVPSAILFITAAIMYPYVYFTIVEDRSLNISILALYFISSICGVFGIAFAIPYIWKLKWKVIVNGDVLTIFRMFSKHREINFSDIVAVRKFLKNTTVRGGYRTRIIPCYSVYVRSSKSSGEKMFIVNKQVNGFELFESHLLSSGIQVQGAIKKNKVHKPIVILLLVFTIWLGYICVIYDVGMILSLIFVLTMAIASLSGFKESFSKVCFNKAGVTRKLFFFSYISVPWDSFVDIGIGKMHGQDAMYDCIYFSTIQLTNEQINRVGGVNGMGKVKQNRRHLWCECDDAVLAEVLQYVDKDSIKNLDLYESIVFE